MAIYHLHVKNISRGEGRSAVAAAAYRAGQTLPNEAEEKASAFGGRRGVIHTEIRLPAGAPSWMADRARLWNEAEAAEKRKDARLAKEIEFALPRELDRAGWIAATLRMADHYVAQGVVVDLAIHDDGTAHNPHAHMLLTTRVISPQGFAGKQRKADGVAFVHEARALWASIANAALAGAGVASQIDARSHQATGVATTPSKHRGPNAAERRKRRKEARMETDETRRRETMAKVETKPRVAGNPGVSQVAASADDRPVPGPDGRPITPNEQDRAERAMLAEVERQDVDRDTEWWLADGAGRSPSNAPEPDAERGQWWERER